MSRGGDACGEGHKEGRRDKKSQQGVGEKKSPTIPQLADARKENEGEALSLLMRGK